MEAAYILIYAGCDGLTYAGPFSSREEAKAYRAESLPGVEDWRIQALVSP